MLVDGFMRTSPATPVVGTLLLAHGAGAPMDSEFMNSLSSALGEAGVQVLRFEFPYMTLRRQQGGKRPPNPMPVLLDSFREHYKQAREQAVGPLFIGGKSMGGRVASLLADELSPAGLMCFGYPFHPPGKPERLRTEHLLQLQTPTLILQGTRDPFGKKAEVDMYALSEQLRIHWLESGDHDFKPLKSSGLTQQQLIAQAAQAATLFMRDQACIRA